MAKPTALNPEIFENLLAIFSSDRDEAGKKYEQIRGGLIRFFYFRGCSDGEALADETINRVALKLDQYDPARAPKIASYFYGFATNILREQRRSDLRTEQLDDDSRLSSQAAPADDGDQSERLDCLTKCMSKEGRSDFNLIVEYYGSEGPGTTHSRRSIAEREGLSMGALHTRIFRMRSDLRNCVEKCLAGRKI